MPGTSNSSTQVNTEEDLLQLARAFRESRIFLSAHELGIFTALGDEIRSSADIADALDLDPRATNRLMNALVVIGLLERRGDDFVNSPLARRHLVEGSPDYFGHLGHANNLWNSWSTLSDAVRNGGSVMPKADERGDERRAAFIGAMHHFGQERAAAIAASLDLAGVRRVLDVGGGSGIYAQEILHRVPEASAVIMDRPEVIPLTGKYTADAGMQDRVSFIPGDFNVDDLGTGYDMVLLFAIIHMLPPEGCQQLITRCAASLNPGGQLVIREFVVNEDRSGPADAVLFAINMLVGTDGGDSYTRNEMCGWMEHAGLRRCERKDPTPGTSLLIGYKD